MNFLVIGGDGGSCTTHFQNPFGSIERCDLRNRLCERLDESMKCSQFGAQSVCLDNNIYVTGGIDAASYSSGTYLDSIEMFD